MRGAWLAVVAACAQPPSRPREPAVAVLPDVPFAELDHAQRVKFMTDRVVPAMQPVFQRHDAKRFAKIACETCHGKAARAGTFELPNADLPRLTSDLAKFDPHDVEWMTKEVMPAMADLLARPVWSTSTPNGLTCLACHTMDAGS